MMKYYLDLNGRLGCYVSSINDEKHRQFMFLTGNQARNIATYRNKIVELATYSLYAQALVDATKYAPDDFVEICDKPFFMSETKVWSYYA